MAVLAPRITPRAALSLQTIYTITQTITYPTVQTYTTTLSLSKPQPTQTSQSHSQSSRLSPSSIGAIVGSILGALAVLLLLYCCCVRQTDDGHSSDYGSSYSRSGNTPQPQQVPEPTSLTRTPAWFGRPVEKVEGNLREYRYVKKKKKKHRPPQFVPQQ